METKRSLVRILTQDVLSINLFPDSKKKNIEKVKGWGLASG